ncbi:hypothetical protein J2X20_000754 [Pelomonas saccharophila]|uniref:Uncharacterized protein n=1 Tax=Roseateles saccharophilus TaxID=304 RepID=A0ABU1YH02_ROSSA|nr:hypothetical protein [Roseateles saccharophilus]MDR7268125.1 hypothetical protein [Roseateles saccharophilus]
MRAAFSLLALVIVAAIVLSLAKKQATALKPAAAGASSAAAGGAALPTPKAVGQQVQNSIDEAARKAAEAASASTN